MKPIIRAEEMSWVDRQTLRQRELSSWELMKEVAGEMADCLESKFSSGTSLLFLCGPGNNGGDAYCVAEKLRKKFKVFLFPVFAPATNECKRAAKSCRATKWEGGKLPDVIVDGIFGNSQRPGLDKNLKALLKRMRSKHHIALDLPTGVSDEHVDSSGFRAELTLMVGYPKRALISEKAAELCGEIQFVGKNFVSPRFWDEDFLEDEDFKMPLLKRTAFKSGRVGVLAGSSTTPGAAFLAAEAAARMQVGYVHLFYPLIKHFKLNLERASFLYQFGKASPKTIDAIDAWVVGPGGVNISLLKDIARTNVPAVLDADALPYQSWFRRSSKIICTPHPGEAARILGIKTADIQSDRIAALHALVKQTGKSVYLKGAPGLFLQPGEKIVLNYSLRPVLARAGSGDVLAGIIGGMIVKSPGSFEQACLNAFIFQRRMAKILSEFPAAVASDQLRFFSETWRSLRG